MHRDSVVTVSNIGKAAAREVVQLYLNRPVPVSGVPMAEWALKGYQRTALLEPGTNTTINFQLNFHDLSTVEADGSRVMTLGEYTVKVGGGHPRDIRCPAKLVAAAVNITAECALLV